MKFPKFKFKAVIAFILILALLFIIFPVAAGAASENSQDNQDKGAGFAEKFISNIGFLQISFGQIIMILVAFALLYLAIVRKYEPMLMVPLAIGILMANMPLARLSAYDVGVMNADGTDYMLLPGLLHLIYQGLKLVVFPPLVFLCIGTMTDFGPLIASPRSAIIGLGAQFGIFAAFGLALAASPVLKMMGLEGFTAGEAGSIGIIGGADGPTAIFTAVRLAPELLASVAIAAFSYMALVPMIQPPIMKILTTKKERLIVMPEPKKVTKRQKIIFPIAMMTAVLLFLPSAGALVGMLMFGNLIRECGVLERYSRTLPNDFLNILTIFVGISVGSSARADYFLTYKTLIIIVLGLLSFAFGTFGGVVTAKVLNKITGGKINPLIGNAGVSAMPMAARISQKMGQKYDPQNHLLMHAMGPLVAGVIGSGLAAGIFLALFS